MILRRIRLNRRGSTFIIVLAILSILVLIATTLSFTSRLEVISSKNYSSGLQARMSAVTGVERATNLFSQEKRFTATTQRWAIPSEANFTVVSSSSSRTISPQTRFSSSLSEVFIFDACAATNLNAADAPTLERVIAAVAQEKKLKNINPQKLALEIVKYRYGPDGAPGVAGIDDDGDSSLSDLLHDGVDNDLDGRIDNPEELYLSVEHDGIDNNQDGKVDDGHDGIEFDGVDNDGDGVVDETGEGIDEPDEFQADIRRPPRGDDRPFLTVGELQNVPGITPEIYEVLQPYFTVFSASDEIYHDGADIHPSLPVNLASAVDMYQALKKHFPEKNDRLLKQFAVNIVDFRDRDSVPTRFPSESGEPEIIGTELTPYINEVWADSLTLDEDGDDGQYIELFNPYSKPLSLEGWQLIVGGRTVLLNGQIYPNGYVIVTDDYNERNDPTPEDKEPHYGSFYSIFGLVPNGTTRRIIEDPGMEIPNNSGKIVLKNNHGNLIDFFEYSGGTYGGVNISFQRDDPRVRYGAQATCSPFAARPGYSSARAGKSVFQLQENSNHLFASPGEVLFVSSGFAQNQSEGVGWMLPGVSSDAADRLDCRVVDLFTITNTAKRTFDLTDAGANSTEQQSLARLEQQLENPPIIGKINPNTATLFSLLGLPSMDENSARAVIDYRTTVEKDSARNQIADRVVPFASPSDLLALNVLWKDKPEQERIENFARLCNAITVNSRSLWVLSQSAPPSRRASDHKYNPVLLKALVATDGKGEKIVSWRYEN
jgi:hypothetical protein